MRWHDALLAPLRRQLRHDKRKCAATAVSSAAQNRGPTATSQLYDALQQLGLSTRKRQANSRLKPLIHSQLTPIQASSERQKFCASLEAGSICEPRDLYLKCRLRQRDKIADCALTIDTVPSLRELELSFLKVKRRLAIAHDGLPSDVYPTNPRAMAKLYHALFVKSILTLKEPISWK